MSKNEITERGILYIADAVSKKGNLSNLRLLDLSWNVLGHVGALNLAECLKNLCQLKELNLQSTKLETNGMQALCGAMSSIRLKRLDLSKNNLDSKGMAYLCRAIEEHYLEHLQELELSDNNIDSDDQGSFFKVFRYIPWLLYLNLSNNNLGPSSAEALKKSSLSHFRCLEKLILANNVMGLQGVAHIIKAVLAQPQKTVKTLDLSNNQFNPDNINEIQRSKLTFIENLTL